MIEAIPLGFALFDKEGRLMICNARFRDLNPPIADLIFPGQDLKILLREAVQRGVLSRDDELRLDWMESTLADGALEAEPIEIDLRNGIVHYVAMRATSTGGFVLVQSNVTQRKRYEETRGEADLLLQKVLEACPANIIMSRIDGGQIIYRTPAATELIGSARNSRDYFASRGEQADLMTTLLPDGRVDSMAANCLRPDGSRFPASVSARMIDYRGEDVVVSTIVDLTHEVEMQAQLAAQRETIYQNEKMSALGELLAGVAHELNNPLSVVVGHALMLREEATDPEAVRRIEKIGAAAERCAGIVKSFLAMARQEPAVLAPIALAPTLDNAIDAFQQSPSGGRLRIDAALSDPLPPLLADADQITQVLINLLINADQAIADSGVGGRVQIAARHDRRGGMVELRVTDDGPGVPAKIRGRIFDPLFTTKDVGKGTGIGLAYCHRVATSHGGRIDLDLGPRSGATFVLRLPIANVAEKEGGDAPAEPDVAVRARLLVVDDENDVADMIREILTRDGFEVDHAASGEAALDLMETRDYALVFTDLNMPGLGGRGLYDAVSRRHPGLAERVGFVTGDTMSPSARSFLDAAGRPYLEKPISPAELRRLARAMLAADREPDGR